MSTIIYGGSYPFDYYLFNLLGKPNKVNEDLFFAVVGYNRREIPMHYDEDNVNRQNFFFNGQLIGYRER